MGDSQLPAPSSRLSTSVLKILHVIPSVSQSEGGPSYAVFAFARAANLGGAETLIVTTGNDDLGSGETECVCFQRNFEPYKISFSLYRWLRDHVRDFDLVHIHALFSFSSWAAVNAAQKQNVPYVIRPLGVLNRWGLKNRRRFLKQWWLRFIESPILERAAAIHYTSQAERDEAAMVGEHIREPRSFIVPIPVKREIEDRRSEMGNQMSSASADYGAIRPAFAGEETFLRDYPQAQGKKIVLFLARLDEKKGLDVLLQAFVDIRREHGDAVLMLAGSGPGSFVAKLHQQAQRLGVADDVIWTGFLSGPLKSAVFSAATIYVLPSYSENFGIAAAEALAFGVPTVLSDQVAIAQDAAAAKAAVVVRPEPMEIARAINQLLNNLSAREELGRNGKRFAEDSYSMEHISQQLVSEYRRILNLS